MTIYSDCETSMHDSEPIECYEFVGSYKTYLYTSGDLPVSVNGRVFAPIPITRTNVKAGTHNEDNLDIRIEMPITTALVKDYGFQITPPRLRLTIYRVHRGTNYASDYAIYWTGDITSINISNNKASFTIPSVFGNAMAGTIPSVSYQTPCNHVLFDSGCKISRAANMVTTTVVTASGNSVQIASSGAFPDG